MEMSSIIIILLALITCSKLLLACLYIVTLTVSDAIVSGPVAYIKVSRYYEHSLKQRALLVRGGRVEERVAFFALKTVLRAGGQIRVIVH
jgi:hypothetical protein